MCDDCKPIVDMVSAGKKGKREPKGPTPNHSFIWSQICMHFIPFSSIEKILSTVFQQIHCSSYPLQDMSGSKGTNAKNA